MQFSNLLLAGGIALAASTAVKAERLVGLTFDNRIVSFNAADPEAILSNRMISGLAMGEQLIGIDMRPATGSFYVAGRTGNVYELNRTGSGYTATPKGMLSVMPMGNTFGFDFNPVPDRLRIISDTGQNLRANVDTGLTFADGMITSDTGMVQLLAAAYTNNFAGATTTTLYAIDAVGDRLVRAVNPNAGTYTGMNMMGQAFQPLGFSFTTSNAVGFDISGRTGMAFANIDSLLWSINLDTGAGTALGIIGAGPLRSIATSGVVPEPATWGLMIAGFGLVGAAARRRRMVSVAAA